MTSADKIADYYKRHPGLSIRSDQLLTAMKDEGTEITLEGLRGGMVVLRDEKYFGRDPDKPYIQNKGPCYIMIKSGYVSKKQKASIRAAPSQSAKDRYSKKEEKEAKETAWERLRYLLICGPWQLKKIGG